MASVNICNRITQGNNGRTRLNDVKLGQDVKNMKEKISADINVAENLFDIVYCGQCLKEGASLESSGVHQGSTLHLIARITKGQSPSKAADIGNAEMKQLLSVLQTTLKSPAYKSTVEKIVTTPDLLHDLAQDIPGLDTSPSTLTLFMDHELLSVLAHPGNLKRVIEAHPCFPQVAHKIATSVKEADSSGDYTHSSTGTYSLDQMSDDDDDDETAGPSGRQAITANQLAAALAAATSSSTEGQVQQMREMGITDESVARQALQATNGDLQAALDLLFGGGLS